MEKDCHNCRFEHYLADEIPCIHCGIDGREYWQPKAKTNADRIRAMDDELLATQITQVFREGVKALTKMEMPDNLLNEVRAQILEKLKQPAEGE